MASGINSGDISKGVGEAAEAAAMPKTVLAAKKGAEGVSKALDAAGDAAEGAADNLAGSASPTDTPTPSGGAEGAGKAEGGGNPPPKKPSGAGGTSDAGDGASGLNTAIPGAPKGKAKHVAAAAAAAPAAAQTAFILMIINWLKFMMMQVLQVIAAIVNAFWAMLVNLVKTIIGFFVKAGTILAHITGLSTVVSVGTAAVSIISAGAAAIGSLFTWGSSSLEVSEIAKHDGPVIQCDEFVKNTVSNVHQDKIDDYEINVYREKHAKDIYSVYSSWGMGDENIAAILGNWEVESGLDPTAVETIFGEPYHYGPKKQEAESHDFDISYVNQAYGNEHKAIGTVGIGYGQWTNERNHLLREYAKEIGQPWYTLETQLGFSISKDDDYHRPFIEQMINDENPGADSVDEATIFFLRKWEGLSTDNGTESMRKRNANFWFAKMGQWEANADLAGSILDQANVVLDAANDKAVKEELDACISSKLKVDNSTMAKAMASYSWPMFDDSKGNDGTYLYYWLHEQIWPGDIYFASCDRSVTTAIRWSGSDDDIPMGDVSGLIKYFDGRGSDKWEKLDWGGDPENLVAGDVLIRKSAEPKVSHVVMYIGEDVPKEVWGEGNYEPGATIASGSCNDRSPAIGQFYTTPNTGLQTYSAYRLVKPDNSSTYSELRPPSTATPNDGDRSLHNTPSCRTN